MSRSHSHDSWLSPALCRGVAYAWWVVIAYGIFLASYRRLRLDAKVGPSAPWRSNPALLQQVEQTAVGQRQDKVTVRVLTRHRKRLPPFLIEVILAKDLRAYELSDFEEQALRRVVLDTAPKTASDLAPLFRHGAALVRFANRAALWDISKPRELFSASHLTQFMQSYRKAVSEDLYNQARGTLTKAAKVLYPDNSYRDVPRGRRQEWSQPTDEEALRRQWEQAADYPVQRIRFMLLSLICLCRGAGLRTEDLQVVHGSDVVRRQGGRTVVLIENGRRAREAVVLRRYAPILRQLAAQSRGALMLEGVTGARGVMEPARRLAASWDEANAEFPNPHQLANAYFLEIAQRRVRVSRIFKLLGGNTLRGFEDLRRYMEEGLRGPQDDVEGLEDNGIAYFAPSPEDLR